MKMTRFGLGLAIAVGLAATLAAQAPSTPVADAARKGDLAAVRTLLKQGADASMAHGDGMTRCTGRPSAATPPWRKR